MDKNFIPAYEEMFGIISARKHDYAQTIEDQCAVWEGKRPYMQPLLVRGIAEKAADWPKFSCREIHLEKEKMLLTGMAEMAAAACGQMQALPSIRANMGPGIYPSLFPGIVPLLFDDDRVPWIKNTLSKDTIKSLSTKDIKITDEFKLALEHTAYMADKIEGSGAHVFPLDYQDAIDIAHLVYGDDFFYDLYDDPDFIRHLLDLCCYAMELGFPECVKLIPKGDKVIAHQNELVMPRTIGGFKFSMDTSTLLSPDHICEFTIPCLKRLLDFTGGAYVHFCGRHDAFLDEILKLEKVRGINLGQPEKHNIEEVLRKITAAGKVYYGPVPKNTDETYEQYFSRVIKAATDVSGRCRLLLTVTLSSNPAAESWRVTFPQNDLETIKSEWKAALNRTT